MRFQCAHCNSGLSIELDWKGRAEIPIQCGKCDGISVLKSKSRALALAQEAIAEAMVPTPIQETAPVIAAIPPAPVLSPAVNTNSATPPPFRGSTVKVPGFLKNKVEASIRAFENEPDTLIPEKRTSKLVDRKKWIVIASAIALLSGGYMIWNATRTLKRTYRFSQNNAQSSPAKPADTTAARIAN